MDKLEFIGKLEFMDKLKEYMTQEEISKLMEYHCMILSFDYDSDNWDSDSEVDMKSVD